MLHPFLIKKEKQSRFLVSKVKMVFCSTLFASKLPHLGLHNPRRYQFKSWSPTLSTWTTFLLCMLGFRTCICSAVCLRETEREIGNTHEIQPQFYSDIINLSNCSNIQLSFSLSIVLLLQRTRVQVHLTIVRGAMLSALRPRPLVPLTGAWVRSPPPPQTNGHLCWKRSCMVPCPTWLTTRCRTEAPCLQWTLAMATWTHTIVSHVAT